MLQSALCGVVQVDELRQRAERSDAKELEGRSLQLWLAGGGEGRVGLTDMDLLRFIMFRYAIHPVSFSSILKM